MPADCRGGAGGRDRRHARKPGQATLRRGAHCSADGELPAWPGFHSAWPGSQARVRDQQVCCNVVPAGSEFWNSSKTRAPAPQLGVYVRRPQWIVPVHISPCSCFICLQCMEVARKSFTQKEHEERRWRSLVQAGSVVGLVQHAREWAGGSLPPAWLCLKRTSHQPRG